MKKKLKNIFIIVLWIITGSGLLFALGFSDKEQLKVKGKSISIEIAGDEENEFLDQEAVIDFLRSRGDTLINQTIAEIKIHELEKSLDAHPSIKKSNVAVNLNGEVKIDVFLRKPIVRIFNVQGESYYIDEQATLMPISDSYTSRVPVANGMIVESFERFRNFQLDELANDTLIGKLSILDDVYAIGEYIRKDSLLKDLIHQIYINNEREIVLYPAVADLKIIFGTSEDLEDKFRNLKIFYLEGLNSTGNWRIYDCINLKYKNQVVCTKKTITND
jgi:cell division protein FtsQ